MRLPDGGDDLLSGIPVAGGAEPAALVFAFAGVRLLVEPVHGALVCSRCGLVHFPRIAPAVIVLVECGAEMLLARSHRLPPGIDSTLAGFVEPGESVEEAVPREIREEAGALPPLPSRISIARRLIDDFLARHG